MKFIRYGQFRIDESGIGILAYITNHGYLDNPTFRGMRQSLMQSFNRTALVDLHGKSKKKVKTLDDGKDENVFDIMQGVAVGCFVKQIKTEISTVSHADIFGISLHLINSWVTFGSGRSPSV